MSQTTQHQGQFFNERNFYSPHASAGAVWLVCVVVGSLDANITSVIFRYIALFLSLAISLGLALRTKKMKDYSTWLLLVFNTCLIFVNASGINAIVNNLAFEPKKTEIARVATFKLPGFLYQKSWWPDAQLSTDIDSLKKGDSTNKEKIRHLLDQYAFIDDWISDNIHDTASKRKLKDLFTIFGHYEQYPTTLSKETAICNARFDSLNISFHLYKVVVQQKIDGQARMIDSLRELSTSEHTKIVDTTARLYQMIRQCSGELGDLKEKQQGAIAFYKDQATIASNINQQLQDSIVKLNKKISHN